MQNYLEVGELLVIKQWHHGLIFRDDKLYTLIKNSNYKCILFFCAEEFELILNNEPITLSFAGQNETVLHYEKLFLEKDIEVHFIFGSKGPNNINNPIPIANCSIHYWDTFWFYGNLMYSHDRNVSLKKPLEYPFPPTKLFTSMINKGHTHRCEFMDSLAERQLLDQTHYSWHCTNIDPRYEFKHWKDGRKVTKFNDGYEKTLDHSAQFPRELWEGAVHLVSESTPSVNFWTEKTCNAIYFGLPFIIQGGYRTNLDLKLYGFEIFEELFNYSFDIFMASEYRLAGLITNLVELKHRFDSPGGLEEIRDLVRPKLIHNRKVYEDIITNRKYIPRILQDLSNRFANGRDIDEVFELGLKQIGCGPRYLV